MGVMKLIATKRMLGENIDRFLPRGERMAAPAIRVHIDPKGLERFTDFTFDSDGGLLAIKADGRDARKWIGPPEEVDEDAPPITIGQESTLQWLFRDGLDLDIADDGSVTVVTD